MSPTPSSPRSPQRLDLLELDVRNVLSYYSMLRTKPAGKYNVQVCTNISCMLRGGYEILDHCKHKLGIGHKEVDAGRRLLARRGRVHRRLLLGSGHSGQLRLPREPDACEVRRDLSRCIATARERTKNNADPRLVIPMK